MKIIFTFQNKRKRQMQQPADTKQTKKYKEFKF